MSTLITIAGITGGDIDLSPPPTPESVLYDEAPPRPEGLTYG